MNFSLQRFEAHLQPPPQNAMPYAMLCCRKHIVASTPHTQPGANLLLDGALGIGILQSPPEGSAVDSKQGALLHASRRRQPPLWQEIAENLDGHTGEGPQRRDVCFNEGYKYRGRATDNHRATDKHARAVILRGMLQD